MAIKFKEVFDKNKFLGLQIKTSDFSAFFGSRNITDISPYVEKPVCYVKQTHSNIAYVSNIDSLTGPIPEADAHHTTSDQMAVGIVTADCIPLLIYSKADQKIAAIHAGWRGLLNGIIENTFQSCGFQKLNDLVVMVGPHIKKDSFEIQSDALPLFIEKGFSEFVLKSPTRITVDLTGIAKQKLLALGCSSHHIYVSDIDTFKDPRFFSFRREKKTGLRNYSAITLAK